MLSPDPKISPFIFIHYYVLSIFAHRNLQLLLCNDSFFNWFVTWAEVVKIVPNLRPQSSIYQISSKYLKDDDLQIE